MTVGIVVIVDRLIANAQGMLDDGTYGWPASRAGLQRILADLEARSRRRGAILHQPRDGNAAHLFG